MTKKKEKERIFRSESKELEFLRRQNAGLRGENKRIKQEGFALSSALTRTKSLLEEKDLELRFEKDVIEALREEIESLTRPWYKRIFHSLF